MLSLLNHRRSTVGWCITWTILFLGAVRHSGSQEMPVVPPPSNAPELEHPSKDVDPFLNSLSQSAESSTEEVRIHNSSSLSDSVTGSHPVALINRTTDSEQWDLQRRSQSSGESSTTDLEKSKVSIVEQDSTLSTVQLPQPNILANSAEIQSRIDSSAIEFRENVLEPSLVSADVLKTFENSVIQPSGHSVFSDSSVLSEQKDPSLLSTLNYSASNSEELLHGPDSHSREPKFNQELPDNLSYLFESNATISEELLERIAFLSQNLSVVELNGNSSYLIPENYTELNESNLFSTPEDIPENEWNRNDSYPLSIDPSAAIPDYIVGNAAISSSLFDLQESNPIIKDNDTGIIASSFVPEMHSYYDDIPLSTYAYQKVYSSQLNPMDYDYYYRSSIYFDNELHSYEDGDYQSYSGIHNEWIGNTEFLDLESRRLVDVRSGSESLPSDFRAATPSVSPINSEVFLLNATEKDSRVEIKASKTLDEDSTETSSSSPDKDESTFTSDPPLIHQATDNSKESESSQSPYLNPFISEEVMKTMFTHLSKDYDSKEDKPTDLLSPSPKPSFRDFSSPIATKNEFETSLPVAFDESYLGSPLFPNSQIINTHLLNPMFPSSVQSVSTSDTLSSGDASSVTRSSDLQNNKKDEPNLEQPNEELERKHVSARFNHNLTEENVGNSPLVDIPTIEPSSAEPPNKQTVTSSQLIDLPRVSEYLPQLNSVNVYHPMSADDNEWSSIDDSNSQNAYQDQDDRDHEGISGVSPAIIDMFHAQAAFEGRDEIILDEASDFIPIASETSSIASSPVIHSSYTELSNDWHDVELNEKENLGISSHREVRSVSETTLSDITPVVDEDFLSKEMFTLDLLRSSKVPSFPRKSESSSNTIASSIDSDTISPTSTAQFDSSRTPYNLNIQNNKKQNIDEIITGLMHLLGDNVKVAHSVIPANASDNGVSSSSTRINHRGPPRFPDEEEEKTEFRASSSIISTTSSSMANMIFSTQFQLHSESIRPWLAQTVLPTKDIESSFSEVTDSTDLLDSKSSETVDISSHVLSSPQYSLDSVEEVPVQQDHWESHADQSNKGSSVTSHHIRPAPLDVAYSSDGSKTPQNSQTMDKTLPDITTSLSDSVETQNTEDVIPSNSATTDGITFVKLESVPTGPITEWVPAFLPPRITEKPAPSRNTYIPQTFSSTETLQANPGPDVLKATDVSTEPLRPTQPQQFNNNFQEPAVIPPPPAPPKQAEIGKESIPTRLVPSTTTSIPVAGAGGNVIVTAPTLPGTYRPPNRQPPIRDDPGRPGFVESGGGGVPPEPVFMENPRDNFDITLTATGVMGHGPPPQTEATGRPYVVPVDIEDVHVANNGERKEPSIISAGGVGDQSVFIDGRRTYFNLQPTDNSGGATQVIGAGVNIGDKNPPRKGGASPPRHPPSLVRPPAPSVGKGGNIRNTTPLVRIDTCIVGDETACDGEHHEMCRTEGGVSSCSCRPGFAKSTTKGSCSAVVTLLIFLRIDRYNTQRMSFIPAYYSSGSEEYQSMQREVIRALDTAFPMTSLAPVYSGSTLNKFYPIGGKLAINATIFLQETAHTRSPTIRQEVSRELISIIRRRRHNIGASHLYVDPQLNPIPGVQDVNECTDPELNDCSPNAQCENTFGGFKCSCLPGFTDKYSNDKTKVGRYCSACSPEYCNHHGECVLNDGKQECRCKGSFIGSRCEIDGEVLGVALGASLAALLIIILTLVCLCMWSRRWKKDQQKTDVRSSSAASCQTFSYMNKGQSNGYRVTMEDRMRWAQINDPLSNYYATDPLTRSQTPLALPAPGYMTVAPPPPLTAPPSVKYSRDQLARSRTSLIDAEEDAEDSGRFHVPRPKSRSAYATPQTTQNIYYDLDYGSRDLYPAGMGQGGPNSYPMQTMRPYYN